MLFWKKLLLISTAVVSLAVSFAQYQKEIQKFIYPFKNSKSRNEEKLTDISISENASNQKDNKFGRGLSMSFSIDRERDPDVLKRDEQYLLMNIEQKEKYVVDQREKIKQLQNQYEQYSLKIDEINKKILIIKQNLQLLSDKKTTNEYAIDRNRVHLSQNQEKLNELYLLGYISISDEDQLSSDPLKRPNITQHQYIMDAQYQLIQEDIKILNKDNDYLNTINKNLDDQLIKVKSYLFNEQLEDSTLKQQQNNVAKQQKQIEKDLMNKDNDYLNTINKNLDDQLMQAELYLFDEKSEGSTLKQQQQTQTESIDYENLFQSTKYLNNRKE